MASHCSLSSVKAWCSTMSIVWYWPIFTCSFSSLFVPFTLSMLVDASYSMVSISSVSRTLTLLLDVLPVEEVVVSLRYVEAVSWSPVARRW